MKMALATMAAVAALLFGATGCKFRSAYRSVRRSS